MEMAISSEFHVIDFKLVSRFRGENGRKKGELEFPGKCHDVIENTWWKNVTFRPCHDIDENKRHTQDLPRCF